MGQARLFSESIFPTAPSNLSWPPQLPNSGLRCRESGLWSQTDRQTRAWSSFPHPALWLLSRWPPRAYFCSLSLRCPFLLLASTLTRQLQGSPVHSISPALGTQTAVQPTCLPTGFLEGSGRSQVVPVLATLVSVFRGPWGLRTLVPIGASGLGTQDPES